jgi:hypothetical protein
MKYYVTPYLVSGAFGYWSSGDYYNHSAMPANLEITIQTPDGMPTNVISEIVAPWEHFLLTDVMISENLNQPDGRCTVLVACDDSVMVTNFIGRGDSMSVVPANEVDSLGK